MGQYHAFRKNGVMTMNKYRLHSNDMFQRREEGLLDVDKVVFLSVEGNDTEVDYFNNLEKFRKELGINSMVHVHVLGRAKRDTNSSVEAVLELLEEYIELRKENGLPQSLRNSIPSKYSNDFILSYLHNEIGDCALKKEFEKDLEMAGIDYSYSLFLKKYKCNNSDNDNDVFGIVIDRDWQTHTPEQLKMVYEKCKNNGYMFFISNPCFEFWLLLHLKNVKIEYASQLNDFLKNEKVSSKHTFTSKKISELANHSKTISTSTFQKYYLPNIDVACDRAYKYFTVDCDELIGANKGDESELGSLGTNLPKLFSVLKNK